MPDQRTVCCGCSVSGSGPAAVRPGERCQVTAISLFTLLTDVKQTKHAKLSASHTQTDRAILFFFFFFFFSTSPEKRLLG